MAKTTAPSIPELLRISGRSKPLAMLLTDAVAVGLPIVVSPDTVQGEIEDASAIDLSLATEPTSAPPPTPLPGTSYAGLTPAQRYDFLTWSRKPEVAAPIAFQQIYLANLETRLLEEQFQNAATGMLISFGAEPTWVKTPALHRAYLLACWLQQDGQQLTDWVSTHALPTKLLGIALGLQALIGASLTAPELGKAIATWQLGARLPTDLLKLRLDSLTAILGQPPLTYSLSQLDASATTPRPWRTSHRGLRLLIPQPDLRPTLEASMSDLLIVADVDHEEITSVGTLDPLDTSQSAPTEENVQPSLEELGWRLILEFGSNRSEYFDYVLIQAQKLAGYSQLMDEDRRIVYRIIFRKSEMRRFWRLWDYVHGWAATRVYLNGAELEKWKVWPYSQYLR